MPAIHDLWYKKLAATGGASAHKEAGHVRRVNRNGRDHTKRFRDLVALAALKPTTFTLLLALVAALAVSLLAAVPRHAA